MKATPAAVVFAFAYIVNMFNWCASVSSEFHVAVANLTAGLIQHRVMTTVNTMSSSNYLPEQLHLKLWDC